MTEVLEFDGEYDGEFDGEYDGEFSGQEWEDEANRRRQRPRRSTRPRAGARVRGRFRPGPGRARGGREYVRWVQSTLNQIMSLRLPEDGTMGPAVRSAVRSFQEKQGLLVNGIVGPDTERSLLAARGDQAPAKDASEPAEPEPAAKNTNQSAEPEPPETEYGWQEWESWQGEGSPKGNGAHDRTPRQELRSKIAEIAKEEWKRWGRGPIKECEPRGRSILEDYWQRGVGHVPKTPNYCEELPWSAVFISWVIRKASEGTPFKDAFHYSNRHTDFVGAAKKNKLEDKNNPFKAYRISEVVPRVGDLVCSGVTYENVDKDNRPPHCDIVTEVLPGKEIKVIGGNRRQSVAQRSIQIDHKSYIKEPEYYAVVRIEA